MIAANNRLVSQMQAKIEAGYYGDTANYITRAASTPNSFGELTYTETTTSISCSFTDKASAESWRQFADIQTVDGEIRFNSVVPSKGDAITITGRFDDPDFTDKRYHIVGIKDRGAFGFVCALKAVDL
jgi:hypothetical protein